MQTRQKVKHYCGKNIPNEAIDKINYIYTLRNNELTTKSNCRNITSIEDLCDLCSAKLSQLNIILGEDWYIIYSKNKCYIEIIEWFSIKQVTNKLCQTMEMLKALKEILLLGGNRKIIASMILSTSYKFYRLFLERGYIKELYSFKGLPEDLYKDIDDLLMKIQPNYQTIEEYLSDESREIYSEYEPYFSCEALFTITPKFKKRYKRKNDKQRNSPNQ